MPDSLYETKFQETLDALGIESDDHETRLLLRAAFTDGWRAAGAN